MNDSEILVCCKCGKTHERGCPGYTYAEIDKPMCVAHLQEDFALEATEGRDYLLKPEFTSAWVSVDNISVYIVRTDEGVSVDLYPKGDEMSDSIAGTWALFADTDTSAPFQIQDDTFGFIMLGEDEKPLKYETVNDALAEIRGWFSQQSKTQSFTVINSVSGEAVGSHNRDDFEPDDEE